MASTIKSNLEQGSTAQLNDRDEDSYYESISFDFGDIINYPDGNSRHANDTVIFEVVVMVVNSSSNVAGKQLNSTAAFSHTGASWTNIVSPAVTVVVVEPRLNISVVSSPNTNLQASDIVTYTVTVQHTNQSSSAAFGLSITDLLLPSLVLVDGSVTSTAGVPVNTIVDNAKTVNVFHDVFLLGAEPITVTYRVNISTWAVSNDIISNIDSVVFSSAPLGVYNAANLRNRTAKASSDIHIVAPNMTVSMNTSTPETPGANVTIGELITFSAVITLPYATTREMKYTLRLPSSLSGKFGILSGTVTHMPASADAKAFPKLTKGSVVSGQDSNEDNIVDTIVFSFGDVINTPHTTGELNALVVDVLVAVLNVDVNENRDVLNNFFVFEYYSSTEQYSDTQLITTILLEPSLVIAQAVVPATKIQASNTVNYTVTITHSPTSTSPAYLSVVMNTLSDKLSIIPESITTSSGVVDATVNNTVIIRPNMFLLSDSPIVITYSALVTTKAVLNSYVQNAVNITYYSNTFGPINSPYVRSYNNLANSQFLMLPPKLSYDLNSTSISQTAGFDVAIGETISFLATITIPAGTLVDTTVTFTLPYTPGYLGVVPSGGSVVFMPSNIVGSLAQGSIVEGQDSNFDGVRETITFNFGTIVNTPPFVNNTIVLEVIAMVVNIDANMPGVRLPANCSLVYSNGIAKNQIDSSHEFLIVGPKLLTSTVASPTTNLTAGAEVTYKVLVWQDPSSTSAAFSINIVDLFSRELEIVPSTITTSAGSVATGNIAGETVSVIVDSFDLKDNNITVSYKARLTTAVPINGNVQDSVTVYYDSSPSNAYNQLHIRKASATATNKVKIAAASGGFNLTATSIPETKGNNVTFGETMNFTMSITVPPGTAYGSVLTVNFPKGQLEALYGEVSYMPSNFHSDNVREGDVIFGSLTEGSINNVVSINFGDLANEPSSNRTIMVTIVAGVVNTADNVNGITLSAVPSFSYTDTDGVDTTFISLPIASVSIVTAQLVVTKTSNATSTLVMGGSVVEYTVTVRHSDTSTAPAFVTRVIDKMSSELTLIQGTVVASNSEVVFGNTGNESSVETILLPYLNVGSTIQVTYSANLTRSILPNSIVKNTATVVWSPYPTAAEKDWQTVSATASIKTAGDGPLYFSVTNSSLAETNGTDVSIGEHVTMTASITVIEGTMTNATLTIAVPKTTAKLSIVKAYVQTTGNSVSTLLATGSVIDATDTNKDNVTDTAVFDFGTIVNYGYDRLIHVSIVALVVDIPANGDQVYLNSSASFVYGNITTLFSVVPAYVALTVKEPKLNISSVAFAFGTLEAGSIVQYTLNIGHTNKSSSASYLLSVTDKLSNKLALVPGSVDVSAPQGLVSIGTDGTVDVKVSLLTLGSVLVVKYNTTLTVDVEANTLVSQSADVSYLSSYYDEVL